MTIRDRRTISQSAKAALAARQQDMQRILLIYLGIITGLSLGASILTVVLSNRIETTGGLSNMGLRSILSTAQTLLPLVQMLVFWGLQIGYTHATMKVYRGEDVSQDTLFGGFRRFLPMTRVMILQGFLYGAAAVMSLYLAVYLFLLMPVSAAFQELIAPVLQQASVLNGTLTLDEATVAAASDAIVPVIWIFIALFLLLFIPMYYRYRMSLYRLIDHEHPRALVALLESRNLMQRSRITLLKLDLSFWWYYGLQILCPLVCYGDLILSLLGITLPVSDTVSYFLFLILSLAVQFVALYFTMNPVSVTYAAFYDTLVAEKKAQMEARPRRPVRPNLPWKTEE